MNVKRVLGNFSFALVAQFLALAGNVVTNLIAPKMMGVSEFGYWQLFIFYTSYVYLFHLGLNDGVYLFNGGLSRKKVNKASINTQFVIGMLYQVFFSTVLVIGAFCIHLERERVFVLIMTGIYLLVNNGAAFIGYLLQAMDETKK